MIPYIGGKSRIANFLISNFPEDYRTRSYIEVFGGGGWVLFKKDPSNLEVYNDLNSDLVNLFRVIRDNYAEFEHRAEWVLHSREMFAEALKRLKDDDFCSDVEHAMFYAIRRMQTFSASNTNGWGYQVKAEKKRSNMWAAFLRKIDLINARLKQVQIECLDFERLIKKYDSPNAFFYLDPPYVGTEHYYKSTQVDFLLDDHRRLASVLKGIQGKFMLSYYEHPLVRELYGKKYRVLTKEGVKSSCGAILGNRDGLVRPRSEELVIMNY